MINQGVIHLLILIPVDVETIKHSELSPTLQQARDILRLRKQLEMEFIDTFVSTDSHVKKIFISEIVSGYVMSDTKITENEFICEAKKSIKSKLIHNLSKQRK